MRLTGNSGGTDAGTLAYLADGLGSVQAAAGNMVTGGPVAATSVTPTNSYNEAAYPSAKTIDGDTTGSSGFWAGAANTTTPSMLTLELGSSQTVSRVKLHRVATYLADYTVKAADVQLRQADNSWLTVGTLSGNTAVDSPEIAFTPAASSAVRVIFKGARVGTLVLVAEVTLQLDSGPSSLATQRFDAWGNLLQATGSIPTYGYTGREPDQSGLTYFRARYYHPGLGRFVSRDPMGMAAGINPYAYASGNPVNFNDPSGLLASKTWNVVTDYAGRTTDNLGNAITSGYQSFAASPITQSVLSYVPGAELMNNATANFKAGNYGYALLFGATSFVDAGLAVATGGESTAAKRAALEVAGKAGQIHNALDPIAQNMRTTAVLRTNAGDIAASGARDLTPAQRSLAQAVGATPAALPGAHAEVTAIMSLNPAVSPPQTV
jgi:RHS repeat-associated protein